ncbi:MAG: SEC-C metal-binding domain-containing protein [Acidimicrobiales bacterium]
MIRSSGGGAPGRAEAFLRTNASPRAVLLIASDVELPSDWPANSGGADDNLGHVLGWTLEVRRNDIVIMNPLGEGMVKAPLPPLSDGWLQNARHDGSCAVYIGRDEDEAATTLLTIDGLARNPGSVAATIRTSIADDYGTPEKVGRNEPCPCGSGKKFKHCHG